MFHKRLIGGYEVLVATLISAEKEIEEERESRVVLPAFSATAGEENGRQEETLVADSMESAPSALMGMKATTTEEAQPNARPLPVLDLTLTDLHFDLLD
eukprot:m.377949 g.377949  ORF g.377949 m.377949 type:complete len:99 (-) comp56193_c0_seq28:92-388(-)